MEAPYEIILPKPISTNQIWRRAKSGMILSPRYKRWKETADAYWMLQKNSAVERINGPFLIEIVVSNDVRRKGQDIDNLGKVVLDWLQRVEIIKDDALCEMFTIRWGTVFSEFDIQGLPRECLVKLWDFSE